jgi:hypothetical protein
VKIQKKGGSLGFHYFLHYFFDIKSSNNRRANIYTSAYNNKTKHRIRLPLVDRLEPGKCFNTRERKQRHGIGESKSFEGDQRASPQGFEI